MKLIFSVYATIDIAIIILFTFAVRPTPTSPGRHASVPMGDTAKPPKIWLEKKSLPAMTVLFIRDTASTNELLGQKLSGDFARLSELASLNKLGASKFLAWYSSIQAPWSFEAGVQVDSLPTIIPPSIRVRRLEAGQAIIAHMQGPYEQISQAYQQIFKWVRQNKRQPKGGPFEVYVTDPNKITDPDEIRTDVYLPLQD